MKRAALLVCLMLGGCADVPHKQCAGVRIKEIGATREQLIAACGMPERINHDQGSWGTKEQFVYSVYSPPDYVYVDNNIVTALQY